MREPQTWTRTPLADPMAPEALAANDDVLASPDLTPEEDRDDGERLWPDLPAPTPEEEADQRDLYECAKAVAEGREPPANVLARVEALGWSRDPAERTPPPRPEGVAALDPDRGPDTIVPRRFDAEVAEVRLMVPLDAATIGEILGTKCDSDVALAVQFLFRGEADWIAEPHRVIAAAMKHFASVASPLSPWCDAKLRRALGQIPDFTESGSADS